MSTQLRQPTLPPRSLKVRTERSYAGDDLQALYDQIKALRLTGKVEIDFHAGRENAVRFVSTERDGI